MEKWKNENENNKNELIKISNYRYDIYNNNTTIL